MKSTASGRSSLTKPLLICSFLAFPAMLRFSTACNLLVLWKPSGSRITLVKPGVFAGSSGPIQTETDPDLAGEGYQCRYLSRSDTGDQIAFVRREFHTARIQLWAMKTPLEQREFSYMLCDKDGKKLSEGRLIPISPDENENGENGVFEISDAELSQAERIVVYKK